MSSIRPVQAANGTTNRVPEPDALFWVVKVVTTGMGETASDYLVKTFAPEAVVPIAFVALIVMFAIQFRLRAYRPGVYWATALMVSVFGTMAADVLHIGLGVPYLVSTVFFAAVLAGIFAAWWRTERTLSVHAITTDRRERLYWATVLTTFALGTATGDLTATTFHLGYLGSGVVFAVLFAIPGVVHAATRGLPVATFWAAYVLTRPLGASLADWFAAPGDRGGLNLGPGEVTLALLVVFIGLVGVVSVRHRAGERSGDEPLGAR